MSPHTLPSSGDRDIAAPRFLAATPGRRPGAPDVGSCKFEGAFRGGRFASARAGRSQEVFGPRRAAVVKQAALNLIRYIAAGWLLILMGQGSDVASAEARRTTPPPAQKPVDFNHPPRAYVLTNAQGWAVWVEAELWKEHPELASNALARLDRKLEEVCRALPGHAQKIFSGLTIFLMLGEESRAGGRNNGAEYYQRHAPEHFPHLDPRMGRSLVICSARNFVWLSEFWSRKLLVHEFAHAWHLEQWPEAQDDIWNAYQAAMAKKLYRQVKDDHGKTLASGYAAANQLEYFAELSCAYFVGCNYQPFGREELKAYDAEGYGMIEKMWRVGAGASVEGNPP